MCFGKRKTLHMYLGGWDVKNKVVMNIKHLTDKMRSPVLLIEPRPFLLLRFTSKKLNSTLYEVIRSPNTLSTDKSARGSCH